VKLYKTLSEFDYSDGEKCKVNNKYDLRNEDDLASLDDDSADAASCVEKLCLSYDINARHYSTVVDGDRITDMVDVQWTFWVEKDDG